MRIYYATKTGRGCYCGIYGKKRCVHTTKKYGKGQAPLLISEHLGAGQAPLLRSDKLGTGAIVSKLSKLSLAPKKNNIRFDI
jgi:hypothetical protein